ncbi:MAG: hypothetical protein KAQ67_01590 [Gammaproteobacteria bacterium]|nr:hypothetical protein [Gammaproteobacteria bacterium]
MFLRVFLFLLCLFSMVPVHARQSPFFMALKMGIVDHGESISDSAVNMAINVNYLHNQFLATEVEYSSTIIDGSTNTGNDWQADSLSIFAALRTNTRIKLKGKIGLTNLDGNDGLNIATGIGIGYWGMGGLIEIEYTKLDDGVTFLSFGVNYFY